MPSTTQVGIWPVERARRSLSPWVAIGLILTLTLPAHARLAGPSVDSLKQLSIEELMEIEVTSVSRRAEKLIETASAIQVVTGEQIRRSGAVTLPQALRLAGNLSLAQTTASNWTVSARGFNSNATTSNKLLVMIDGRSVYSPLFSGTFWDTQDVFLPDVDRIEVVSGPGGATWGANAVNGVINVVTKSARDTQGTLIYGGGGDEERLFGGVRHGGKIGQGHYRVYAKRFDIDGALTPAGADTNSRYVLNQAGFRADWDEAAGAGLTIQGDIYDGSIEQAAAVPAKLSGGNLLARWTRPLATEAKLQLQAYYDYAWRWSTSTFADRLETFDVDAQHQFALGDRHLVVWGLNHRMWIDHVRNIPSQAFIPADDTIRLTGLFVQDEVELIPERLRLTIGAKYEYNDYSGSDLQPSARVAWLAAPQHTLWAAVSRAVRTPSRVDRDLHRPPSPPFVIAGGPEFASESLLAYELGWRGQPTERLAGTITLFQHDYDDLRSIEPSSPALLPLRFSNGVAGRTLGAEVSIDHRLTDWWQWSASYVHLNQRLHLKPGSRDLNQARAETSDPENQFQLGSSFDLPGRFELDLALRRVGAVPTFANGVTNFVPAYTELDVRIGWLSSNDVELALTGRNLLHKQHAEAGVAATRQQIERSIHAQITWQF